MTRISLAFLVGAFVVHDKGVRDCQTENELRALVNGNQIVIRAFLKEAIIARRADGDLSTVRVHKRNLRSLRVVAPLSCGGELL